MAIFQVREAIKIMVGIMEGLITGQGIMVAILGGLLGVQTFSLEIQAIMEVLILAQREVLLGRTGMATMVPKLNDLGQLKTTGIKLFFSPLVRVVLSVGESPPL